MESYDIAESGYPEESPVGSAPDDAPGTAPQEQSADPKDAARNAPDNDGGGPATGNPATDGSPG